MLIISVADADSGKTPSTEPVTAPVQAPLSQEESGHANAQQGTQPTLSSAISDCYSYFQHFALHGI